MLKAFLILAFLAAAATGLAVGVWGSVVEPHGVMD